jgi:FkbM family methyltransferase
VKIKSLFSLRRMARCRQAFHHPWATHVRLAMAANRPIELDFVNGGRLVVQEPKRCRRMFEAILSRYPDPAPVGTRGGLLSFRYSGQPIHLRPNWTDFLIFEEIFVGDVYRLADHTPPLGTVIDLGANIGLFSLRAAPLAERVVALEPVEDNAAVARINLAAELASERVRLVPKAAAARSGDNLRLFVCRDNPAVHSVSRPFAANWGSEEELAVPTVSLADLIEEERIDRVGLLKCDVEGSEYDVVEGLPKNVLSRIDRIAMEVHLDGAALSLDRFHALRDKLRGAGFRIAHEPPRDADGLVRAGFMLTAEHEAVRARRLSKRAA